MERNREKFIKNWMSGIKDEIGYWDWWMRHKGGPDYHKEYLERIKPRDKVKFPAYLKKVIPEGSVILDVGSGPLELLGTKGYNVTIDAVDPLAVGYKILKNKYNLDNGVEVKYALAEDLSHCVNDDYDVVFMKNALDHCFSPIRVMWELLKVAKERVVIQTARNEAVFEGYEGFHQWNLDYEEKKGSLCLKVWRHKGKKIEEESTFLFEGRADIRIEPLNDNEFLIIMDKTTNMLAKPYRIIGIQDVLLNKEVEEITKKYLTDYLIKTIDSDPHQSLYTR